MSTQEIQQQIEQLNRYLYRLPAAASYELVSELQQRLYALRAELAKQQLN